MRGLDSANGWTLCEKAAPVAPLAKMWEILVFFKTIVLSVLITLRKKGGMKRGGRRGRREERGQNTERRIAVGCRKLVFSVQLMALRALRKTRGFSMVWVMKNWLTVLRALEMNVICGRIWCDGAGYGLARWKTDGPLVCTLQTSLAHAAVYQQEPVAQGGKMADLRSSGGTPVTRL